MSLSTHASRAALLLAVLAAAACGGGDAADSAAPAAAATSGDARRDAETLADVADYELTMAKIDRYMAAQRNLATKAAAMSPAEREAYEERNDLDMSDAADLDEMAARIEREPLMRDAIRDAGLSAREFTLITLAMVQSAMGASVLQMRPNDDPDSLAREMKASMKNIRFFQEHQAEIQQKQQALQAEMKALGLDVDEDDEGGDDQQ